MLGRAPVGIYAVGSDLSVAGGDPFALGWAILTLTASGTMSALPAATLSSGSAVLGLTAQGTALTVARSVSADALLITPVVTGTITSPNELLTGDTGITLSLLASGQATAAGSVSGLALVALTANGSAAVVCALTGSALVQFTASGQMTAAGSISGTALLSLLASGSLAMAPVAAATAAWLMNTVTGGHARYDNYPFNAFFRLGSAYYGCGDSGISRLDGTRDNTTPISWRVLTGVTNFGINTRKYVTDARMALRSNGDVALREIIDEQIDRSNLIIASDDRGGLHARRVKLPKGLHGTDWQFEVSGTDVVAMVDTLEVQPLVSPRT